MYRLPMEPVLDIIRILPQKNKITYVWHATREGIGLFYDMGDTRSSEEGTNVHGLFGAIIVEAAESKWLDPETGKELESGLFADI